MKEVEIVVAHNERTTLRIGDRFLKINADQANLEVEAEAMDLAPIPTPEVLWRQPHDVLPADLVSRNRELAEAAGRGRRCSPTATCDSPTCSSTATRSPA